MKLIIASLCFVLLTGCGAGQSNVGSSHPPKGEQAAAGTGKSNPGDGMWPGQAPTIGPTERARLIALTTRAAHQPIPTAPLPIYADPSFPCRPGEMKIETGPFASDPTARARIRGCVFDTRGRPLTGVDLNDLTEDVEAASTAVPILADYSPYTNHQGLFVVTPHLLPSTYVPTARAKGYRPESKVVKLGHDQMATIGFVLQPVSSMTPTPTQGR